MEEKNILEAIVTKDKMFFPKGSRYNDEGEFTIITFSVEEVIQGKPKKHPIYGTITVKGNMPRIVAGKKYHLVANEVYDETYKNYNYEVNYIGDRVYSIDNKEDIKTVLQEVTSENNVNKIMELENIVEILKNKDASALQQVKGIGESLSAKIIEKFSDKSKFGMSRVILSRMGLSERMIEHLRERYSNYDLALEKVKKNPYMLADEVKGIGFLRADALAKKFNIEQNSPFRIAAFVSYYLNKSANEGRSFVSTREVLENLRSNTDKEFPIAREVITETFNSMKYKNELWWNDNKSILALPHIRKIELEIANHLMRLMSSEEQYDMDVLEPTIKTLEKRKGFNYTDEQREGIKTVMESPVVVVTGKAGCVDCETEFLTEGGWKRIDSYKEGDKVLQFNEDRTANFVYPERYIKQPTQGLTHITNLTGRINQVLSDNHTFVYETSKGNINKKTFKEVKDRHLSEGTGFHGRILTTFDYNGEGIDVSDDMIRVMVMTFADGSFYKNTTTCHLRVKKERKIERARKLLSKAKINYKERITKEGYTIFTYSMPTREKRYSNYWYKCSNNQLKIVCDEVLRWDGSIGAGGRKTFSTTIKTDADFIQFAFSSIGMRATISTYDRVGQTHKGENYIRKSKEYTVVISKKSTKLGLVGDNRKNLRDKAKMEEYKSIDGYEYCFTVPSGMLVLRRGDRIFITGNCGKTAILEPMTEILIKQQGKKITQCALSGKASQRMAEVTGYPAATVHTTLQYNPKFGGFLRGENYPLETDVIVWDEFSMADAKLVLDLLKATKTGTKLCLVGDNGQLQSIGFGDVLLDLINSGIVPVVELTQIHRQAQASAIITESIKARNLNHIVSLGEEGHKILGELQDLEVDTTKDKTLLQSKVIKYFKEALKREKGDIMEVQVVVATRTRGDLSTFALNNLIKDIVNPYNVSKSGVIQENYAECVVDKTHKYKVTVGDKIIITKNNRKVGIWNEEEETFEQGMVCNGNIGIVKKIELEHMLIEVYGVGLVMISKKDYNTIELGYAVTIFKSQGSQFNSVIVAIDSGVWIMLCCELLYTAITRAKNHCVLVGETKAIRRCCSVANGNNKQTFLPSFLEKLR